MEDYLSELFQLIAAEESAGEQAFVRFEKPRFWFLNVQINSQAGLGVLSAACSVCDGTRFEEVLNAPLFPEGPLGVAAVATWVQTVVFIHLSVVPLGSCGYCSLCCKNSMFNHDASWRD